jgi:hypothetical protein
MRVEVNNCDRAIRLVHAAEKRQGNGVVASERDHSRECLAMLRDPKLFSISGRLTHENRIVAFFNLVDSPGIIVPISTSELQTLPGTGSHNSRRDRNITTIQYLRPRVERIRIERDVVSAAESKFS